MPAYDRQWINILHMTTKGNKDADNILKLCIYRNGLVGKFAFQYWGQRKEMLFALGTPYDIVVEQFKRRRGSSYGFVITVDGIDLVHKNLKDIQEGLRPQTYNHVKIFTSNPWQPSMPSNVGEVKNFQIDTGKTQGCCKIVLLWIAQSYLSMLYAGAQKSLIGKYTYKGNMNGKNYWIKSDGTAAIWYSKYYREWSIGNILSLGSKWRSIAAEHTSANCPTQNQFRWHYFNGVRWKPDLKSHIHVQCMENYSDFYNEAGTVSKIYSFDYICK